jgi:hypothetical protein
MSAAQGLILGLAVIAYMVKELAENFEEKKDQLHKSLLAFSTFFIMGMEFTAIGIAKKNSYGNAEAAYTFALVITVLVFLGMVYRIYKKIKEEARSSSKMRDMGS